ncbi:MAG TPA: aldose epimerase family protein [Beijerinckiaceae bacterium]|nr:aldose epimerase family protein [Beijerinckiaceae bacterium]
MSRRNFGTFEGRPVDEVMITSEGAEARIIEYGAVLRDLIVPRADGGRQRVVLGLNSLRDYELHSPHFGAIAGRYANRIGGGTFRLDGWDYQIPKNQAGKHALHGGGQGFGKRPWTILAHDASSVTLGLVSSDGDAGFPGTLTAACRYVLKGPTLRVELTAFTDKPTICNLTNHSYFKLDDGLDVLDHDLQIRANLYTPIDEDLIPDGTLAPVSGTPFDFRRPRPILMMRDDGERAWYDHNWVLRRDPLEADESGLDLALAARLSSQRSKMQMEVWTTEPCLQFYDAERLNLPVPGLDGAMYGAHAGLCLETQHAPDSPNLPHMPSTVLRPGELYRHVTEFRFGPIGGDDAA